MAAEERNSEEEKERTRELELEKLRTLLENHDAEGLHAFVADENAIDFAQQVDELSDEEIEKLTPMLTDEELGSVMEQSEEEEQTRIAKTLDNDRILNGFATMQKDDIVDMLGEMPIGRRKELINAMKADDRQIITNLLQYPGDSAGGLMTTEYIALREDRTVGQGLSKIEEIGPKTEVIETIFIVDPRRRLIGWCDLRDILSSPKDTMLRDIMHDDVISVQPETDQEETAKLVSRYDLKALPVVSATNQILGIITVDDIIDVIVEEYDEDMMQMAGVSSEESLETTLWQSVRLRLPWLLVNLATAFLASFTVRAFEGTIEKVVALSSIMTIVSGMGGNAGSQTTSILIRALSQNKLHFKDCIRPLFKEVLLAVINGAACGIVTAIVVYFMYGNVFLGIIVIMSMIGNLLVAGVCGFLIPVILSELHLDPAVSSSIFLTTATDVLGFFIFLGLATLFLPYLV
ncbi:MAG TPA: magnesium transporter [Lachnospiraceae bacterium]|jgi:magnesium transporter|nr:magnesium transporter [Lachnospiraceae bacterium]